MPHYYNEVRYATSDGTAPVVYKPCPAIEWYWTGSYKPSPEVAAAFDFKEVNMRRIVMVTVVDPDTRVPADHSLLFMSPGWFVTDCNDDELKMGLDIKVLLDRHNAYREQVVDKEASKGRSQNVYLDPANIRDLCIRVHELR